MKTYSRIEWLENWDVSGWATDPEKEEAREALRQENSTALSYSSIWFGLAAVLFAIVFQEFGNSVEGIKEPALARLVYIEIFFFVSMLIMSVACMIFWDGCSTDHPFEEYAGMNENADSLVMLGSLILLTGFSLLFSFFLMKSGLMREGYSVYALPFLGSAFLLWVLDRLSVVTKGKKILPHYFVEAVRVFRYHNLKLEWDDSERQATPASLKQYRNRLIEILENKSCFFGKALPVILFIGLACLVVFAPVIIPWMERLLNFIS